MKNKLKTIFIFLLTVFLFSSCTTNSSFKNKSIKDGDSNRILFTLNDIPNVATLSFLKPECSKIASYSGDAQSEIN